MTNLTEKKIWLVKDWGMGTLFESAEEVWKLMSTKHLSEVIATVREAGGVKGKYFKDEVPSYRQVDRTLG